MSHFRPPYDYHAGFYRSIQPEDDLSKPWESTPVSDGANLPKSPLKPMFNIPTIFPNLGETSSSSPVSTATSRTLVSVFKTPPKEKSLWARILRIMKLGAKLYLPPDASNRYLQQETFSLEEDLSKSIEEPVASNKILSSKVELHEWKQYGYWARPILNEMTGINSPVTSEKSIDTAALRDIVNDMGDETSGRSTPPHKRFIPGVKHRALPPRPTRWTTPVLGEPLPFPWEVQINPLLQHVLWGPSPLTWCLFDNPRMKTVRFGRTRFNIFVNHQDLAQPATWPFLTHMYFNAVAGDTAPTFPWPFYVQNVKGITVGDVLEQIYKTFWEPVSRDENESWPMIRQEAATRAWDERCRLCTIPTREPFEDCMRRCDALGGIMWFRGIEPTIDAGGWMITFGTH